LFTVTSTNRNGARTTPPERITPFTSPVTGSRPSTHAASAPRSASSVFPNRSLARQVSTRTTASPPSEWYASAPRCPSSKYRAPPTRPPEEVHPAPHRAAPRAAAHVGEPPCSATGVSPATVRIHSG